MPDIFVSLKEEDLKLEEANAYFSDLNHTHEILQYINDEEIQFEILCIYSEIGIVPLEIYLSDVLEHIVPKEPISIICLEEIVSQNANIQNLPQIIGLLERMEFVPESTQLPNSIDSTCWFLIKLSKRLRKACLRYKGQINNKHIVKVIELFERDISFNPSIDNEFWQSVYCALYERRKREITDPLARHYLYPQEDD